MASMLLTSRLEVRSPVERSRLAVDVLETAVLVVFFASLILKGFWAHRDALYSYMGGFLLFGFTTLRYRQRFFFTSKTLLAFGAFAALACLSALWSHDARLVFLDARELIASIPAMLGIYNVCRTEAGTRRVLFSMKLVLMAAVAGALALGAYSYANREFLLMNSSMIAPFMLMSFSILFIERQTRKRCLSCAVAMIVALVPILIVSSVRAVAVIAAVIGFYLFLLNASSILGRLFAVVAAAGLVGLWIAYGSLFLTALEGTRYFRHYSHMQAFVEEGALEGSVGFRLMAQGLAIDMIKERPVLGHGFNNSRYMYERWIGIPTYSHSGFMELLIGLGWVGFFVFLLVFYESFSKLKRIWSVNKYGSAAGLSILVGFIVFNFIGPMYSSVELLIVFVLLSAPGMLKLLCRTSRRGCWRRRRLVPMPVESLKIRADGGGSSQSSES